MAEPAPIQEAGPGTAADRPRRLDGQAIAGRLGRLDETLGRLERTPGATAETALDAVTFLTEVYGEALARVMDRASDDSRLIEAILDDDLVGHLLVLHEIHPEPVERRVARALDALRPRLRRKGADAELVGIQEETAQVRVKAGGCGCGGAEPVEDVVREAVLAAAPELVGVHVATPDTSTSTKTFVPVEALLRPPAITDGAP
ncbi:NifU family protein [Actinomadura soli]|uniref:NifU family protein n=1 Tax=Actinomadura soli TaxID=2508997 RepID=A0A5C4JE48_9ACTN|nr:NifU family protein [Actinomadura soli]TMR00755.1 NifU family protein [Actinomadura soli]